MDFWKEGTYLGRARTGAALPHVVTVRDGEIIDITSRTAPTVRDICEMGDPAGYVRSAKGESLGSVETVMANSMAHDGQQKLPHLVSPVDLQAIKAAGVTFVVSLLERVIEEQAKGDPARADLLRGEILELVGTDLSELVPGSDAAMAVKQNLIERGIWSQYLEVGIGPDAEIFTKCQPLGSVGHGSDIGLHPVSNWNNPEPEIALAVNSRGTIIGATLGNDVNLRDVEGRSALLLGKAKDNNASASLGPFVRLFDETFGLDDVKSAEVTLEVRGPDGFVLDGTSRMSEISRTPESLVKAALGPHHQYPDGMILYLGTMFAPIKDREGPGLGFTHKIGDVVTISSPKLGALVNTVRLSTECAPWTYGVRRLMGDLAAEGLL
ncbi:fumarylacetoacetate hydrolase family protein [Pelagibacterium sediminicola]|uniref:fumarylacetoacetate hydrolase family protein n=1 Tax=Pelagibacterium sediminicola TaxID=2248761 RepID=UPI000E30E840|nr:fumarylacetoacetate hydrolase family protein [Pelagibacterium sediminicola]